MGSLRSSFSEKTMTEASKDFKIPGIVSGKSLRYLSILLHANCRKTLLESFEI